MRMETQTEKRKFHKLLFVKTCFWFAVIMLLFAVVLGFVYMRLYEKTIMENYREQTKAKAETVAKRCSNYFLTGDSVGWKEYLIMLSEIEQVEVWTIYNENALLPLPNTFAMSRDELTKVETYDSSYRDILNNVFHNIPMSKSDFSEIHQMDMITIGMPVQGINGEVAGGILMNVKVENQKEVVAKFTSTIDTPLSSASLR